MSRFFDDPSEFDVLEALDTPSEVTLEKVAYNFRYIRSCKSVARFLFGLGWSKEKIIARMLEAVRATKQAKQITDDLEAVLFDLATRAIDDVSNEVPPLDAWIQATVANNQGYVRVEAAGAQSAR